MSATHALRAAIRLLTIGDSTGDPDRRTSIADARIALAAARGLLDEVCPASGLRTSEAACRIVAGEWAELLADGRPSSDYRRRRYEEVRQLWAELHPELVADIWPVLPPEPPLCEVCRDDDCMTPWASPSSICTTPGCHAPHDEHRDDDEGATCCSFRL
ncbi:hypothetical protein ACGFX7_06265 [Streptomyces harbinensis]|uniref:hypothetical protein n=1 Tax=Streptomyces harbinensis TaxID=1176198 RepID=UPI003713F83F